MRLSILFICFLVKLTSVTYAQDIQEIPESHRIMIKKHPYNVLGVGAAVIDLLVPVNEDFLKEHVPGEKGGSSLINIQDLNRIVEASHIPPKIAIGGSCANTLKSLSKLGENCTFLGHRGDDVMGEFFAQNMAKMHVAGLFTLAHFPTAQVLSLITPDGQRTMRFFAGSSQEMAGRFLHTDYFKGAKLVHMEAYGLRNDNLIPKAMRLAKESGIQISIDLASFEIVREFKETLFELLNNYVDILFANEDEALELTSLPPKEACLQLQEICPIVVILRGKNGCLVGSKGTFIESPSFPAQVVDTTAAGDLFAAGFLYSYLHGKSLEECALLGNRLGSAIVEVTGSELPQETWDEILKEL